MDLEVFVLCDALNEGGGKINLFGIFDTIYSNSVPFIHLQFTIAIRLRFGVDEGSTHSMKLSFTDPEKKLILHPFETKVESKNTEGFPGRVNVFINVEKTQFKSYGIYYLNLEVDNKSIQNLPLLISRPINQASDKK